MGKSYEWENGIAWPFCDKMAEINDEMPDYFGYEVIGIAVANTNTGEAAFIMSYEPEGDVIESDYLSDIVGDAQMLYDESIEARQKYYRDKKK